LHRDVKPSNILVDHQGNAWITDFGLAKTQGAEGLTETGNIIGTIRYMAPERLNGLSGPRSDLYSLGQTLYELLTLGPAFEATDRVHLMLSILEEDPPPPSKRNRGIPRDMETIVLKAMARDPTERYASAQDLADDLRRFLADRPIRAGRQTMAQRLARWSRRHQGAVVTAGISGVFLLAATTAGLAINNALVRKERDQKDVALGKAQEEKVRADQQAAVAQAVDDFLRDDLLGMASSWSQANPQTSPDPDIRVRTVLDRAAERIGTRFGRQPLVEAAIRYTIGRTYWHMGLYEKAQPHLEKALEIRSRTLGPEHPETVKAMAARANIYFERGRMDDARRFYTETLALSQRVLGPEHPDTLLVMSNLGLVMQLQGRLDEARRLDERVLAIQERVIGPEAWGTLNTTVNLAMVLHEQGHWDQARKYYERALEARRRTLGPEHPDTLISMNNLAILFADMGRLEQARQLFEETIAIEKRALGPRHPDTLRSMRELAWMLATTADPRFQDPSRALDLARQTMALGSPKEDLIATVGVAQYRSGHWKEAVATLMQSIQFLKEGESNGYFFLAMAHWRLGEKSQARECFARAAQWMDRHNPTNPELQRHRQEAAALLGMK
jgi:tetratricopeptide (TPR) repeat protein